MNSSLLALKMAVSASTRWRLVPSRRSLRDARYPYETWLCHRTDGGQQWLASKRFRCNLDAKTDLHAANSR